MPSPLPINVQGECRKAQKILEAFVDPVNGLDSIIPPSILRRAKGFCFMSVAKAGFVFSARAGSGVVIAKLPDGSWSAPSAVGTAGGGFGFQAGVEVAEFLVILNSRKAVKSFMAAGSLMLGGNMSLAAGPLGRNVEGTGTLSSKGAIAAMYSYSRSKGLFGGASVEGSVVVERSDANSKAYGQNVTAKQLLSGAIDPPSWASPLIETITRLTRPGSTIPGWIDDSGDYDPHASLPVEGDEDDSDDDFAPASSGRRRGGSGTGDGLTPREYRERGYAFGSSYASGGSLDPEKERGKISSMLGSMGRSRSGSGSSKKSGGRGGGAEDPFATPAASASSLGLPGAGPRVGEGARFETQFERPSTDDEREFDFSSAAARRTPSSSRPMSREPSFGLGSVSRAEAPQLGRSGSKSKLTKPRSGSGASAGLRERAAGMSWGGPLADDRGRDAYDSLNEAASSGAAPSFSASNSPAKKKPGLGSRFRSSSSVTTLGSFSPFGGSGNGGGGDVSSLSSPAKSKSRLRSSTLPTSKRSPFDDDAASISSASTGEERDTDVGRPGLNRALSKPWDSEDESYFSAPASKPAFSSSSPATGSSAHPSIASPRTPGGHALDLREVEADFASAMDLARNGGEAEVGSYSAGARSRSGTVTQNRSRSGTVTAPGSGRDSRPPGVAKDGIGWAVAKFDFPGVEPTDLPFSRSDLLVILGRDDEEWWRARKGVREGIVPRNYLDAHFD
ncbi:hypothetical protein JCM10213_003488 [Rhodosporidiobolus nylandii]